MRLKEINDKIESEKCKSYIQEGESREQVYEYFGIPWSAYLACRDNFKSKNI